MRDQRLNGTIESLLLRMTYQLERGRNISYFGEYITLKGPSECYYGRISAKKKKFGVEFYYDGKKFGEISREDVEHYVGLMRLARQFAELNGYGAASLAVYISVWLAKEMSFLEDPIYIFVVLPILIVTSFYYSYKFFLPRFEKGFTRNYKGEIKITNRELFEKAKKFFDEIIIGYKIQKTLKILSNFTGNDGNLE